MYGGESKVVRGFEYMLDIILGGPANFSGTGDGIISRLDVWVRLSIAVKHNPNTRRIIRCLTTCYCEISSLLLPHILEMVHWIIFECMD